MGWFAVAFPGFDHPPYELPALEQWHMDIGGTDCHVRAEPTGLLPAQLMTLARAAPRPEVVEVNGDAGDVALLHGWLLHAGGAHLGREARFIANCSVRLTTPLQIDGPSQTPFERSVVAALRE